MMESFDNSPPPSPPPPPSLADTRDRGKRKAEPSSSPPPDKHYVSKAIQEPPAELTVRLRPGRHITSHVRIMHLKLVLRYLAHATPENLGDPSISVSSDMEIDEDDLRCKFCKKMLKGDDLMYKVGCSKSCPKIVVAHKACRPSRQMSATDVCVICGQPFKYYSVLLLSIPVPAPDNI